jgi:hypothetical protein
MPFSSEKFRSPLEAKMAEKYLKLIRNAEKLRKTVTQAPKELGSINADVPLVGMELQQRIIRSKQSAMAVSETTL